jgi:hypothetical protein
MGGIRCGPQFQPQHNVVAFDDSDCDSDGSRLVFLTDRDVAKKRLRRNIDDMLDVIYGPTEAHPKTMASVNAMFDHIDKLGGEIRREKRRRKDTPTGKESRSMET